MTGGLFKSASTLAILAAACLMVGSVAMAPRAAYAADLGGDCCADLEARVAELEATTARKGNRKVSLTISGRVNYNIMFWSEHSTGPSAAQFDDTSGVSFGNVGRNESELVLKGDGKVTGDIIAGFLMEIYVDPTANPNFPGTSPAIFTSQTTVQSGPGLQAQTEYVFLKSKSAGELRLGNMYGVIHDGFYQDLGTDTIGRYAQTRDVARFKLRSINGNLTDAIYQTAVRPIDDARYVQLQYISPAFNGFTIKADVGADLVAAAALLYDNKFGTVGVKAAVAYEQASDSDGSIEKKDDGTRGIANPQSVNAESQLLTNNANNHLRILSSSASISESTSGLYLTGVYAQAYADIAGRQDATNWMVKGGWQKNVTGLGTTAIYASYFQSNDLWRNDTSGHVVAIGIDQAIEGASSNLYLQYQRDSYDTDGAVKSQLGNPIDSQSIDAVIGGMIVKF